MHAHCEQRQEILLLVWMDKDVNKDVVFLLFFLQGSTWKVRPVTQRRGKPTSVAR